MKKLISLITFIILVLSFTITASAEWQEKDGHKLWLDSDGTYSTDFDIIDGIGYKFSPEGYLIGKYTGFTKSPKGRKYYLNGEVVKDRWLYVDSKRTYYAGEDGCFLTGWNVFPDLYSYGFDKNGVFVKTSRPDFCVTNEQAAEYGKLKSINSEFHFPCWDFDNLFNSAAIVRDENGIIVGKEDGKDIKMLVRIWAVSEDTLQEIKDKLRNDYNIEEKYYDVVIGYDRTCTPDSELYDKDDIMLSLEIDSEKLTATVENKTELEYDLIEDIKIEMLDGDKWITLPRKDIGDVQSMKTLAANGSATIIDSFPPNGYGGDNLKPGTYRAIVKISYEEDEFLKLSKTIKLAAEFTVK